MSAISNLLKRYPDTKIISVTHNLDSESFAKQKKKIEFKRSTEGSIGVIWLTSSEVVLTYRTDLHPGWALLGGTVEKNEDFDTAFIREAMEEAGVEVIIKRLVRLEKNIHKSPHGDELTIYLAVFEAEVKPGQHIRTTDEAMKEGLQVKSFKLNELPKKMILKDRSKLEEVIRLVQ